MGCVLAQGSLWIDGGVIVKKLHWERRSPRPKRTIGHSKNACARVGLPPKILEVNHFNCSVSLCRLRPAVNAWRTKRLQRPSAEKEDMA